MEEGKRCGTQGREKRENIGKAEGQPHQPQAELKKQGQIHGTGCAHMCTFHLRK